MLGGVLDDVEDIMDDARGIERLLGKREGVSQSRLLGYLRNFLIVWVYPRDLWLFLILLLLQQSS